MPSEAPLLPLRWTRLRRFLDVVITLLRPTVPLVIYLAVSAAAALLLLLPTLGPTRATAPSERNTIGIVFQLTGKDFSNYKNLQFTSIYAWRNQQETLYILLSSGDHKFGGSSPLGQMTIVSAGDGSGSWDCGWATAHDGHVSSILAPTNMALTGRPSKAIHVADDAFNAPTNINWARTSAFDSGWQHGLTLSTSAYVPSNDGVYNRIGATCVRRPVVQDADAKGQRTVQVPSIVLGLQGINPSPSTTVHYLQHFAVSAPASWDLLNGSGSQVGDDVESLAHYNGSVLSLRLPAVLTDGTIDDTFHFSDSTAAPFVVARQTLGWTIGGAALAVAVTVLIRRAYRLRGQEPEV